MIGFAVQIDPFYRMIWQLYALLPAVAFCACPLLLGFLGTERKTPDSFDNDGNLRFRRIIVLISISEYVNDIARYICRIPGAQEVLLVRIHPAGQENMGIGRKPDGCEPAPDIRRDAYYPIKEYFSYLGMTARYAILSTPSHLSTPKILKYVAKWQGSLIVVDQETIPFIREMLEVSQQSGKRQLPSVPVMVLRSDETSWLLHAEPPFGKVLIPVHDTTDFQHLLNFIHSLAGNKDVVLLYFASGTTSGEKGSGFRNGIEQRLNNLAETIHQCGRTVTLVTSTGRPDDEISMIAEKHRVSIVVAFDGGSWTGVAGSSGSIASFLLSSRWFIPVLVIPAGGWIFKPWPEPASGGERGYGQNSAERSTAYD